MKSKNWQYLLAIVFGIGLCGCGNQKEGAAEIPKNLNQPTPKVAAPAGGGGGAKQAQPPGAKVD